MTTCEYVFDQRTARIGERGFTRVEWLLLVLVLTVLAAMVWPKIFARRPYAGIPQARADISIIRTAVDAFQHDTGYFPKGTNGLLELLRPSPDATNWHGPYLDKIPEDPWGRDYFYECPGKHTNSGYPYDLVSLGPPGENSPIANWSIVQMKP